MIDSGSKARHLHSCRTRSSIYVQVMAVPLRIRDSSKNNQISILVYGGHEFATEPYTHVYIYEQCLIPNMAIPESQLGRWSDHGSQDNSKRTHESIRKALESYSWPKQLIYDVLLQGSYKNDTNIRGDSDVDMIIKPKNIIYHDWNALSTSDQYKLKSSLQDSLYTWADFRTFVLNALRSKFHVFVQEGNKSIKIKPGLSRLAVDVVTCLRYRKYYHLSSFVEGIIFFTLQDERRIINYPEQHYRNGTEKNSCTRDRYKQTVRMFKNARNHLINTRKINQNLAPSYFLECLIYNAPNYTFQGNLQNIYCSIVEWMRIHNINKAVCQNKQEYLFGPSAEQWSLEHAMELSDHLVTLWNNWS